MVIINAVECTLSNTLHDVVDSYLRSDTCSNVYTDDAAIRDYVSSTYGDYRCVYNESLVALWFKIHEGALLVITNINNVCSEVYSGLQDNYTILSVEDSAMGGEGLLG